MSHDRVVIFGEVLFDSFPDGSRTLGGAPFNVAWHLRALGMDPLMITRIGNDAAGAEVRSAMTQWGLDTSGLQTDPQLPTGMVRVQFDAGEPQYTIVHPSAFDAIDHRAAAAAAGNRAGLLYHGSLALRSTTSREALEQLRYNLHGITFIDVNLRPPWWDKQTILEWVGAADWVKLNEHELQQLSGTSGSPTDQAALFLSHHGLSGVILTRGERGAAIVSAGQAVHHVKPRGEIRLVDTVGAGDAFTSIMLLGLIKKWAPEQALRLAQDFASQICGQRGALVREPPFYQTLMKRWILNEQTGRID
ncbi:MAG TPA: carbohydrate kinase [Xanthomonadales bacterium]|nr:carbohydrate kinase [Xanthomonadales bacterium]